MDNENKDMQGNPEESELQEKVRQDVSSKIAEAAAEVQDEIDNAEAMADETSAFDEEAADLSYSVEDGVDAESVEVNWSENGEDESWSDEAYVELPKEPKKVTMTVGNLVLSLIGTAVVGALVLFLCLQIPAWIESRPEGKQVASVDGTGITDLDMKYYIYSAAMEYFQNDTSAENTASTPTEYDWDKTAEDGKTVSETVKENAVDMAVEEVLLMNAGDKNGVEFNEQEAMVSAEAQNQQMISVYGEELIILNAKAQGLESLKQYTRKIAQAQHMQAVQADMEAEPSKYYPEDLSVLDQYAPTDKASVKHILINTAEAAAEPAEGEEAAEAAPAEDKLAKAQEILGRAKSGEDFDALVKEFNEDPGATEAGYTFGPGEMMPAFEEAAFALKLNEISDLVETSYGYHIIKRIPGQYELQGYWKEQAKVRTNKRAMDKLSVQDILNEIESAATEFQTQYAQMQSAQTSAGSAAGSSAGR